MADELTRKRISKLLADYLGMAVALAVLLAIFGLTAENFFTLTTFRTIANQIPDTTIAAVGMTFVLIIAGIDLSVGSVLALSGAVLGVALVNWGWPLALAVPVCLLVGLACGAANGLVIIRWRLPSFIVTLGMLEAARGAAYLVTQSRTIYIGGPVEAITETALLGLSLPFVLALAVVAAGQLTLSWPRIGFFVLLLPRTAGLKCVVFMRPG